MAVFSYNYQYADILFKHLSITNTVFLAWFLSWPGTWPEDIF